MRGQVQGLEATVAQQSAALQAKDREISELKDHLDAKTAELQSRRSRGTRHHDTNAHRSA
jgi:hypothetical protein